MNLLVVIRTIAANVHSRSYVRAVRVLTTVAASLIIHRILQASPTPSLTLVAHAQEADGNATKERLRAERENDFRRGKTVNSTDDVIKNMKELFNKILVSGRDDGKADKWYSPHLRDISGTQENRDMEAQEIRAKTSPQDNMIDYCLDPMNPPIEAACPITVTNAAGEPICSWHGEPFGPHRPIESCFTKSTMPYHERNQLSNFKMCCVRDDEVAFSSEQIASLHPTGDGWAGLFEYYYPTAALGWENDRTTSMIVDKAKIERCIAESDQKMEGAQAQAWVSGAIERNIRATKGSAEQGTIRQTVQSVISEIRPKDQKLRFTDSLESEGLTLRVNLAAMDPEQRARTAQRFCMHPQQFDKLMVPGQDPLQMGGGLNIAALDSLPIWANYCPKGVEIMASPDKSKELRNLDSTPTKLDIGASVWETDPMFCQKMNLSNTNYMTTGLANPLIQSGVQRRTPQSVGYTCLGDGNLNGSMTPVTLHRHAAVERRTAISDHALGFLIAGGVSPNLTSGKTSVYKRFEPQKYSNSGTIPYKLRTFIGTAFKGGQKNELNEDCPSLSGENYQFKNKSDRLFISNVTNKAFDQEIVDADDNKGKFNRYRQEWAKDASSGKKIANRGLDKNSQNYAAPMRIFATCPAGYKRWRPPQDNYHYNLAVNLDKYCREENFGGLTPTQ